MPDAKPTVKSTNGDAPEVSVEVLDEGPCRKRMRIEIPAQNLQRELDSNYDQLRKSIELPGFRRGRVPRSLLEKRYASRIEEEVREELIQNTFEQEVAKLSLSVLGKPTFDNVQFQVGNPLRFESVFEVAPTFDVGEYTGLEIAARPVDVTPEQVDQGIDGLREELAHFHEVAWGEQVADDIVEAELILKDGETELLRREKIYIKIGNDRLDNIPVPGLGEKLLATRGGEELTFPVEIPEDFRREDLRNRTVTVLLRPLGANRKHLPENDEELLGKLQQGSMEELRSAIQRNLEARRRLEEDFRQEEALVAKLVESVQMELPPTAIEARRTELVNALKFKLYREGRTAEEVEKEAAGNTGIEEEARRDLKRVFLLDWIADKEQVYITEDEVDERLAAIAATYNRPVEEVEEEYRRSGMLAELRGGLRREKARKLIREKAKVIPPAPEAAAPGAADGAQDS